MPVEASLALRWRRRIGLQTTLGAGVGISNGYGAPDARVILSVGYRHSWSPAAGGRSEATPRPGPPLPPLGRRPSSGSVASSPPPRRAAAMSGAPPSPSPEDLERAAASDPDPDGDGVPSSVDRCPNAPEDRDGFQDGDGRTYSLIHRYNHFGPLPHLLKPRQRIWLPGKASGPLGGVTWLRRDVKERAPRTLDWKPAQSGQALWKLHRVATGPSSIAGIRFLDASRLRMRAEALLGDLRRRLLRVQTSRLLQRGPDGTLEAVGLVQVRPPAGVAAVELSHMDRSQHHASGVDALFLLDYTIYVLGIMVRLC